MTDVQINEAIALHLGWRGISSDPGLGVMGIPPTGNECDTPRIKNAMWTKDLNAMHEAEKVLGKKLSEYGNQLCEMTIVNKDDFPECYIWHATARQRAEAFLKALGKWKEATTEDSSADHLRDAAKKMEEVQG